MAVPLNTLVTNRPTISAVFLKEDELPETIGQYLFCHHALHAICQDAELASPDEQIRGMALGIWDGLSDRNKIFWTERAATARLVRDREDFLLTNGSTSLARDHEMRTRTAVAEYKRSLMSDNLSIADTASIAATELTEEDVDELDAVEPHVLLSNEDVTKEPTKGRSSASKSDAPPTSEFHPGKPDDSHDGNGADSDRELRELQKSDPDDAASNMDTPATSIDSLPPVEPEVVENDTADVPGKEYGAREHLGASADHTSESSKQDGTAIELSDNVTGSVDDLAETPNGSGVIAKVSTAASDITSWIAQSLDWAEESQEQADREAAAQPPSMTEKDASTEVAAAISAPQPEETGPEEIPSRVLWIGSLQRRTTVQDLRTTFAKFGKVEFAKVIPYKACGFVSFVRVESAIVAKSAMNGQRTPSSHDQLLIRFAEDRSRNGQAVSKQGDLRSASEHDGSSKISKPGSNHESPGPARVYPAVVSGNSVASTTTQDPVDSSDNRSVTTATSLDTLSTGSPNRFSAAQLEEAKRFASQATRGGKTSKGKPATLSVAVEKQAKKAPNATALRKGPIASAGSGASTPMPRTPQEDYTPVSTPTTEKIPLAKWEEPVKVRDFGIATSTEPEPKDEDGKGKDFFLFHALPIVCEDLEIDEPDDYAQSIASAMWLDLANEVKKSWIEDARLLRGYSVRKPGLLSAPKRFQDSHFTKDYRSQILKALAVRNNGELKYLQPEFKKLMMIERRRRRQEREKEKRQLKHAAEKEAEAEAAEQKRADPATPSEKETEARDQTQGEAIVSMGKAGGKPHPSKSDNDVKSSSQAEEASTGEELPRSNHDQPVPPSVVDSPALAFMAVDDPPPPYESDSAAAGSSSESPNSEWKIAGQKSKSSAKDTAKRAMKKLPWNKVAKAPAKC